MLVSPLLAFPSIRSMKRRMVAEERDIDCRADLARDLTWFMCAQARAEKLTFFAVGHRISDDSSLPSERADAAARLRADTGPSLECFGARSVQENAWRLYIRAFLAPRLRSDAGLERWVPLHHARCPQTWYQQVAIIGVPPRRLQSAHPSMDFRPTKDDSCPGCSGAISVAPPGPPRACRRRCSNL